jgi:hypothetical protein
MNGKYFTLLSSIPIAVVLTYYDPKSPKKEFLTYDDVMNFFDDERVKQFDIRGIFDTYVFVKYTLDLKN